MHCNWLSSLSNLCYKIVDRLATSQLFLIYHPRAKREGNFEPHKRCKSREVDLFHLQECESEHKFLARKT